MTESIPLIDLKPFLGPSSPDWRLQTAQELVRSLHDVGFVYIKNHGLPRTELDKAFALSKRFYELPMSEKMKAPHPPGWAVHRGYSWPGLEKVSNATASDDDDKLDADTIQNLRRVEDFKESYEIGSALNNDMPNVWPPDEVLPEWKPFMTEFYWSCFEVAKKILQAITLGLGLDDQDPMLRLHSGHYNQLRLLHYPPIAAIAVEEGRLARMPPHSDWSVITMLFQDDCGGLQVESPSEPGVFSDVTPIEGTLVLNVGDLLMRWSNDYLKSTQHRVALPPVHHGFSGHQRLTRARYSIPYFVSPDPDAVIQCLQLPGEYEPKYEPITQRDYAAMRARMQY